MMMSFAHVISRKLCTGPKVTNNWPGYLATAFSTGVGSVVRDMYYSATVSYPQTPLYGRAGHTPST